MESEDWEQFHDSCRRYVHEQAQLRLARMAQRAADREEFRRRRYWKNRWLYGTIASLPSRDIDKGR